MASYSGVCQILPHHPLILLVLVAENGFEGVKFGVHDEGVRGDTAEDRVVVTLLIYVGQVHEKNEIADGCDGKRYHEATHLGEKRHGAVTRTGALHSLNELAEVFDLGGLAGCPEKISRNLTSISIPLLV